MGLARARRTDEQDVRLLDPHILQIGIGDDRVRRTTIPGIYETLAVIRHAQGEPPLGDVLPNHELVQVGDDGSGGWDRGEE